MLAVAVTALFFQLEGGRVTNEFAEHAINMANRSLSTEYPRSAAEEVFITLVDRVSPGGSHRIISSQSSVGRTLRSAECCSMFWLGV